MEFRKAEVSDIPRMVELRKCQLIDEGLTQENDIDKDLENFFCAGLADGSFMCWLAVDGGEVVATGGVCFIQWPPTFYNPSGQLGYVTNMYTVPAYRRQGLASGLLRLVADEAAARGIRMLRLHASDEAVSVYRRFGFEDSDGFMKMML